MCACKFMHLRSIHTSGGVAVRCSVRHDSLFLFLFLLLILFHCQTQYHLFSLGLAPAFTDALGSVGLGRCLLSSSSRFLSFSLSLDPALLFYFCPSFFLLLLLQGRFVSTLATAHCCMGRVPSIRRPHGSGVWRQKGDNNGLFNRRFFGKLQFCLELTKTLSAVRKLLRVREPCLWFARGIVWWEREWRRICDGWRCS